MGTLFLGIVALLAGVWMWTQAWMGHQMFVLFLKALLAVIPVMLVLGGVVAVIAGISSIKEKSVEKKESAPPAK